MIKKTPAIAIVLLMGLIGFLCISFVIFKKRYTNCLEMNNNFSLTNYNYLDHIERTAKISISDLHSIVSELEKTKLQYLNDTKSGFIVLVPISACEACFDSFLSSATMHKTEMDLYSLVIEDAGMISIKNSWLSSGFSSSGLTPKRWTLS